MQFYRKTRQGVLSNLARALIKLFVFGVALVAIIFLIGSLDLPAPNKFIKHKIPNEIFKVIK